MTEINERVTVDFDSQSYYLDGEYWESWDNYGEEMADKINELLNELHEENENITLLAQHNYEESKRIINRYVDKIKELKKENEELKFKLEESNSDKKYVKQVIKDRIKHYHSYSCINKTDIDNGCIGLKIELEHFYDDVEAYLEELKFVEKECVEDT